MLLFERRVTSFLQSRIFFAMTVVVALVLSYMQKIVWSDAGTSSVVSNGFFGTINWLPDTDWLSWGLNVVGLTMSVIILMLLNKTYSFISGLSMIYVSLFALSTTLTPRLSMSFCEPTMLVLVSLFCTMILFSTYENRSSASASSVFLIFTILSGCTMLDFSFLALTVSFFVGLLQMRIFSTRILVAMILGLVTPYWIAFGFGLASVRDLSYPRFDLIFMHASQDLMSLDVIKVVIFIVIGLIAVAFNVFGLMNLKLQLRVYNGFFLLQYFVAVLMMLVDYGNYLNYALLMFCCVSVFVAQFFTMSNFNKRYLFVLVVFVLTLFSAIFTLL